MAVFLRFFWLIIWLGPYSSWWEGRCKHRLFSMPLLCFFSVLAGLFGVVLFWRLVRILFDILEAGVRDVYVLGISCNACLFVLAH